MGKLLDRGLFTTWDKDLVDAVLFAAPQQGFTLEQGRIAGSGVIEPIPYYRVSIPRQWSPTRTEIDRARLWARGFIEGWKAAGNKDPLGQLVLTKVKPHELKRGDIWMEGSNRGKRVSTWKDAQQYGLVNVIFTDGTWTQVNDIAGHQVEILR